MGLLHNLCSSFEVGAAWELAVGRENLKPGVTKPSTAQQKQAGQKHPKRSNPGHFKSYLFAPNLEPNHGRWAPFFSSLTAPN